MKMDLQKFAENDPQQGQSGKQEPNQEPNENHEPENKSSSDKLNQQLSNAINQFKGMNKKMTDFFKNQNSSSESSPEKKPTEKPKEPSKGSQGESGSDYEERIANLEKQLQDQQNKSNQNDLDDYAKSQIKSQGLNVDDDTFNHLKGSSKEDIDNNIKWYSGLAKQFTNNQPPKQPNSSNNGKPPKTNIGAELAKEANKNQQNFQNFFK